MSTLGSLGKQQQQHSRSLSPGSCTRSNTARTPTSASASLNTPLSPALTPMAAAAAQDRNRAAAAAITSPVAPSPSMRESTPEELRALLTAGVVLRKYDLVAAANLGGTATLKMGHIVLFAEGRGRAGSLYWIERDPAMHAPFSAPITAAERAQPLPPMDSTQRVSLESITDFMLRKRSPALKHASGAGDCCFALIYGAQQWSLNLEAPNAALCKMIKEAIITMLTTAGKQVIKAPSASTAATAAAATTATPLHHMALTPSSSNAAAAPFSATAPAASTGGAASLTTPQSTSAGSSTFFSAPSPAAAGCATAAATPFSQTAPTPTSSSSSSLSGLDLLTRGARFMLYTVSPGDLVAPVVAQEIYLWLQPPDASASPIPVENPGALAYVVLTPSPLVGGQAQSKKVLQPGQVHWMGTLKQMQLGKLCAAFAALTPASLTATSGASLLPPSFKPSQAASLLTAACCFSIVFKGASLFLETLGPGCDQLGGSLVGSGGVDLGTLSPTRECIREPWIKAMHGIMMAFTTAEKARKAAAKAAAAAAAAAGGAATPASATSNAAVPPLTPSSSYLAPTGTGSSRNLLATPTSTVGALPCSSFGSPSPTHQPRDLSPGLIVPHPSLIAGMEFLLISPVASGSGEITSVPILLFLSDGEDNTGTRAKFALWYTLGSCAEKDRYALLPSNRFALGAIHRLVSGKAHSAVLSSPACESLPAERCLSIMSKSAGTTGAISGTPPTPATPSAAGSPAGLVWTLLAPTKEAREGFMKNLNQTMLKFRRGAPNAVGAAAAASAAATAAAAAAASTPCAAAAASVPEAPLPTPDFDFLLAGHPARLYHDAGSAAYPPLAEEGLLFFELVDYAASQAAHARGVVNAGEPPGVLYFAPNGRAVPVVHDAASLPPLSQGSIAPGSIMRPQLSSVPESRRLYLHKMTQLVGGKDSEVLQHPACSTLAIDKCFSIVFHSRDATAAASTPSSGNGAGYSNGASAGASAAVQEWNIECANTGVREKWIQGLHAIMMGFSRAKREWKQKQAEAAAAASAAAAVAAATAATSSAKDASSSSSSAAQQVHLNTSPTPVALSSLDTPSSLDRGDGGADATNKLDDSTMLFRDDGMSLGTAMFDAKTSAFDGATAIMRTTVGPGQTYSPSVSPRARSANGSTRDRDPSASPESGAINSSSDSLDHDHHDSNSGSSNSAERHASDGAVVAASRTERSAQHQSLEIERHVAMLLAGQYFTLFTPAPVGAPASEQGKAEEIFLFFQPALGTETPGSLYWQVVEPNHGADPPAQLLPSPERKFLLNEIRQMRSGRVTPILQSALASHVANEVCLSLSNTSLILNLAASSLEARDGWMKAIHSLALQNGMRAKVEAVETHVNGASTMQQPRLREAHSVIVANATPAASQTPTAPRHSHSHSASADRSHRLHLGGGASAASINSTINFQDPTLFFSLGARIGEGSYGSVYRATDVRDGSQVAIKIISFSGADSSKLRNEIRLLRGCQSPYIIAYKGAFQKQDSVWIVTELMSGGSLSDMMNCCRHTFSENQIAVIMRQTLQGLAYLHSPDAGPSVHGAAAGGAGVSASSDRPLAQKRKIIIHRDIKGGNILCDEGGSCKLADFGVSGSLDQSLGKHRTVIGTPHWMAPEVLTSDDYDARADVWSLGITAYELATGAPPHAELHSLRAALKIPQAPPPTLPHPDRYSPDFHSFIAACLVKDPAARPSASELLQHPFIKNNKSTPLVLKDMVAKTVATIEARTRKSEEEQAAAAADGGAGASDGAASSVSPSSRPRKQSMNLDEEDSGDDVDADGSVDDAYDRTTRTITNVQATANLTTVMHPDDDAHSSSNTAVENGKVQ